MIRVAHLNALSEHEARDALTHCCGAARWVSAMLARRPFADEAAVAVAAAESYKLLKDEDWLEAFRHHPKIGDIANLRKKFAATAHLASQEQAGVAAASEATLARFAALNDEYERRHGFIFIVCATGKSAGEMLALLEDRIVNGPAIELRKAVEEQKKITALRLEKI